jgi:hypothetical protein
MVCIFSMNLIWLVKIKFSVVIDWTYKFKVLDIKIVFVSSFLPIFHQHMLSYSGMMWVVALECSKVLRKSGLDVLYIWIRITEHLRAFKNNHPHQSAVAEHMLMKDGKKRGYKHTYDIQNLELIRAVNNHRKLDFYEAYQIHRENANHLMNQDQGPLKSPHSSTLF